MLRVICASLACAAVLSVTHAELFLSDTVKGMGDCQKACNTKKEGAAMACPTADNADELRDLVSTTTGSWFEAKGWVYIPYYERIHDEGTGTWAWASECTADYVNWGPGQPDNFNGGEEACAGVHKDFGGQLYYDVPCCLDGARCLCDAEATAVVSSYMGWCKTCFPASATVTLEGGASKRMEDVQIGDRVLVGPNTFSEVFMFSHHLPEAKASFVKVSTSSGHVLRLTESHYLYVNGTLAPASSLRKGDILSLGDGKEVIVTALSNVWEDGIFNPHTLHGDIVVDGVLTSTYTTAVHPTVAHAVLAPLRMLYSAGVNVYSSAVERAMPLLNLMLPGGL